MDFQSIALPLSYLDEFPFKKVILSFFLETRNICSKKRMKVQQIKKI
jgi:hypothetical protein